MMEINEAPGCALVEMHRASVYRGGNLILHDLSLEIRQGVSTVILGPNGSGKSTLMKLFSRELYPVLGKGGYFRLFGRENWNVWSLRDQLGVISADLHHDYWGLTPGKDVVLSGFFSSIDVYDHHVVSHFQRAQSYAMMKRLGVDVLSEHLFAQMSTGEQRRLLLARALVHDPSTLLLDEPTTGLDVSACFQYLGMLREFIREGKTVILITHHIHEIPPEIDRVVLIKDGQIQDDGPKCKVVNEQSLSVLFDAPLQLLERRGWFQVVPT